MGSSIYNEPCDVVTSDGTHTLSESRYTYTSKGFKTTDKQWTGTTWLTATYAPNTNGTVASSTGVSGLVTTYSYAGGCNNLLLTGTTATVNGAVLGTGATWDCNGAVVMTTTDANGNGTSATYDSMFRPLSSTDESGQTTNFSYASNSVTSSLSFSNGVYSTSTISTVDSLGRPIRSQTTDGATYDTTSISHSFSGTGWSEGSGVPCFEPLGSDCPITAHKYTDPLGRTINTVDGNAGTTSWTYLGSGTKYDTQITLGPAPTGEHVKQVQTELDGLGRVKSTCALQTSGGTTCGQALGGSGVLTSNAYSFGAGTITVVSSRGVQSRTVVKDALGRTLSTTTPEVGTRTYYYDSHSGCPTSSGNLVCYVDPNGNLMLFTYDTLGRVTSEGLSTSTGTCRHLYYDNTGFPPTGVTPVNTLGRLEEAQTDDCSGIQGHQIVDEWFSYDLNGRLTDVWESTPHSGGYYHTNLTYWMNGEPNTLTGIPGYAAYSVALNSNGRLYSSTLGTTVLVNKVIRNAAGQPTTIGFGTGANKDTYTYDANTGRMKTYNYAVGSATDAGTLTWNSNGTLQKLAIVDGMNAGGSQTCNFTYDDIARLLTDNCGSSLWNQTYSYDQYDNLTKTGNPGTTWSPGYTATNNRFIGGTYDANGNVTYDLHNTYTWDAYNKMASARSGTSQAVCGTSGTCVTYDALGRAVEKNTAGTYNQLLYSPVGLSAIMNGMTKIKGRVPLPGWGIGGSNYINHLDWLGSTRIQSDMGSTVYFDTAYTPYSENYDNFGALQTNFTGDNQDLFSGLFDTPNRELDQTSGSRWLSPDPAGAGWNAYAYPTNPNSDTDPTGLWQDHPGGLGGHNCSIACMAFVGVTPVEEFNNGAGDSGLQGVIDFFSSDKPEKPTGEQAMGALAGDDYYFPSSASLIPRGSSGASSSWASDDPSVRFFMDHLNHDVPVDDAEDFIRTLRLTMSMSLSNLERTRILERTWGWQFTGENAGKNGNHFLNKLAEMAKKDTKVGNQAAEALRSWQQDGLAIQNAIYAAGDELVEAIKDEGEYFVETLGDGGAIDYKLFQKIGLKFQ